MRVFISGCTEPPDENTRSAFQKAESDLFKLYYTPVNPFSINPGTLVSWPVLLEILSGCDAIFLLRGWMESDQSRLEKYYCEVTGKPILFQSKIEKDHYLSSKIQSQVTIIKEAIQEVSGLAFDDYRDGPRNDPGFFARMIFVMECKRAGISPQMIKSFINRKRTTILHYIAKYPDECKYNPTFREMAGMVRDKLKSKTSNCESF